MEYNRLFRWFVGLGIDDSMWVLTVFKKSRYQLLTTEMSRRVMASILAGREVVPLLSNEHFSVDWTLTKAWAGMKSFQHKDSTSPPQDADDPGAPATSTSRARNVQKPPMPRSPPRMHAST